MALADATAAGRRLVIFDFDGTLANTVPTITGTARTVLARHGLDDEGMGDLTRLVGPPFPQAYEWVYGFSPEEAAQITAEYRAIYNEIGAEAWPLFPGVRDMLERVREQVAGLDKDSVHILRLSFVGSEVTRPVISEASRMFNIDVNILLGQVDEVQGKGFGTLTILTSCNTDTFSQLLEYLRKHNVTVEEVTSHVL